MPTTNRRTLLAAATGVVGATAGCNALDTGPAPPERRVFPGPPEPGTWPRSTYGPSNTRGNPHATPPTSRPTERWRVETYRTPTVAVGTDAVYLTDDDVVLAVDPGTGEQLWETELEIDRPSLSLVAGRLYAAEGDLVALDAASGDRLWSADPELILSTSYEANGIVYGVSLGGIAGIHADTGEVLWTVDRTHPSAAVRGERLYVATGEELAVYSVEEPATTGLPDPTTTFSLPDSLAHLLPTVTDRRAFVGDITASSDRPGVTGLDLGDGTTWHRQLNGHTKSPAVVDGRGYTTAFPIDEDDPGGAIYGFDADSGRVRWRYEVGHLLSDASVAGDTVFAGGIDESGSPGGVYAVDAATGDLRYELPVAGTRTVRRYDVYPVGEQLLVTDSDSLRSFA